jgi:hypothetical protein
VLLLLPLLPLLHLLLQLLLQMQMLQMLLQMLLQMPLVLVLVLVLQMQLEKGRLPCLCEPLVPIRQAQWDVARRPGPWKRSPLREFLHSCCTRISLCRMCTPRRPHAS